MVRSSRETQERAAGGAFLQDSLLASTYDFTGKEVWEDTGYLPKSHRAVWKRQRVCATEPGRAVRAALPGLSNSNSIAFEDVGHMCQTQMSVTTVALHISVSPDAVVCTKQTLKLL